MSPKLNSLVSRGRGKWHFFLSNFRSKGNFSPLCKIIYLDIIRRNFSISGIFDGLPDKKLGLVNLTKIYLFWSNIANLFAFKSLKPREKDLGSKSLDIFI